MSAEAKEKSVYEIPSKKRWGTKNCPTCGQFMTSDYYYKTKVALLKKVTKVVTSWKWGQDLSKLVGNLKSHQKVYIMNHVREQETSWDIQKDYGTMDVKRCRRCGTLIMIPVKK